MFSVAGLLKTGPSYNKSGYDDQINLKTNLSQILTGIIQSAFDLENVDGESPDGEEHVDRKVGKITPKYLTADYIGIGTVLHSKKLDVVADFELKSEFFDGIEEFLSLIHI